MDELLDQIRHLAEGQIDFKGQHLAEFSATALLVIVGAIAFVVGYISQDIKLALRIGLGGSFLTFIGIVPPWPAFQKHPVKWLSVTTGDTSSQNIHVDSGSL